LRKKKLVFVVLKPDCLRRNLQNEIIQTIIDAGLLIKEQKIIKLTPYFLRIMYYDIIHEHFYPDLEYFIRSGHCLILVVYGINAIKLMNKLKHSLRKKYRNKWLKLNKQDLALWRNNKHPQQKTLNIKLVAENLLHVCDSEKKSRECRKLIFRT